MKSGSVVPLPVIAQRESVVPSRWSAVLRGNSARAPSRSALQVLQVNLGRYCNQTCAHCHVDAGPHRAEEVMSADVRERLLAWIDQRRPASVDLTGGATELIDGFREIVLFCRARGIHVMDRCNLTSLLEPGQEDLAAFLADNRVEVVASLPCYRRDNVDRQRGDGVFAASVRALQQLCEQGYGAPDSGLALNLVYNPVGPSLPPPQEALEADYRRALFEDYGIRFTQLFCLTNMPIARFLSHLKRESVVEEYWRTLSDAFHPANLNGLMCRSMISVSHEGRVYDCDFNQMLGLPLGDRGERFLWDLHPADLGDGAPIRYDDHCLGCAAGAGSSCGGQLAQAAGD